MSFKLESVITSKRSFVNHSILLIFFPDTIKEWNKLNLEIPISDSYYSIFKKPLFEFKDSDTLLNLLIWDKATH